MKTDFTLHRPSDGDLTAIYRAEGIDTSIPRVHVADGDSYLRVHDHRTQTVLRALLTTDDVATVSVVPGGYLVVEVNPPNNTEAYDWAALDETLRQALETATERQVVVTL